MHNKKIMSLFLAGAVVLSACGCSQDKAAVTSQEITSEASTVTEQEVSVITLPETTPAEWYEFEPHVYISKLLPDVPKDYWDSFHNLCDALRKGEDTFECSSQEAYDWATDPVTFAELFPAACMKVTSKSEDGTAPFENGVGKIWYTMPVKEFEQRQADFEAMVVDVLNTWLEPDDDDFEKALKLYDYMESTYTYEDVPLDTGNGHTYYTIVNKKGVCNELSSVYAYFLLQAGVEALQVGCFAPGMDHAWTYVIIDGVGYHCDPTWSLKTDTAGDLILDYFMMTDKNRIDDGCPVDDLTAPLLPKYWAKFSNVSFEAPQQNYNFSYSSIYSYLDEDGKMLYYYDTEGLYCVSYG